MFWFYWRVESPLSMFWQHFSNRDRQHHKIVELKLAILFDTAIYYWMVQLKNKKKIPAGQGLMNLFCFPHGQLIDSTVFPQLQCQWFACLRGSMSDDGACTRVCVVVRVASVRFACVKSHLDILYWKNICVRVGYLWVLGWFINWSK